MKTLGMLLFMLSVTCDAQRTSRNYEKDNATPSVREQALQKQVNFLMERLNEIDAKQRKMIEEQVAQQEKNQAQEEKNQAQEEKNQAQEEKIQAQEEKIQAQEEKIQVQEEKIQVQEEKNQAQEEKIQAQEEKNQAQDNEIQQLKAQLSETESLLNQADKDKTSQSQATFYARGLSDTYNTGGYIDGDRLIYQTPLINSGGHYNSTSGEYRCPTSGVYMFVYSVYGFGIKQGPSHSLVTASLYREGDRVSRVYYSNYNSEFTYLTLSHTDVVSCEAGQRVWIQGDRGNNFIAGYSELNVFGGVLLYTT